MVSTARLSSASSASTVKADPTNGQPVPARDNLSPTVGSRVPPCIPADFLPSLRQLVPVNARSSTAPLGRLPLVYQFDFTEKFCRWAPSLQRGLLFALLHIVLFIYLMVDDMAVVDAEKDDISR